MFPELSQARPTELEPPEIKPYMSFDKFVINILGRTPDEGMTAEEFDTDFQLWLAGRDEHYRVGDARLAQFNADRRANAGPDPARKALIEAQTRQANRTNLPDSPGVARQKFLESRANIAKTEADTEKALKEIEILGKKKADPLTRSQVEGMAMKLILEDVADSKLTTKQLDRINKVLHGPADKPEVFKTPSGLLANIMLDIRAGIKGPEWIPFVETMHKMILRQGFAGADKPDIGTGLNQIQPLDFKTGLLPNLKEKPPKGKIRVRFKATGETGTIDSGEFDASIYEKL